MGLIPGFLRQSTDETELAVMAEAFYRKNGHPGVTRTRAFNAEATYGHILAGPNGAVPSGSFGPTAGAGLGPWYSQGAGRGPIRPYEPVMVDYTACCDGYIADQTRVFSLGGLPDELARACEVMREIQDAVAAEGKPGTPAAELYVTALRMAEEAGLGDGFMGHPEPVPFLGHGVGLELDEWPIITDRATFVLEQGMTLALEPKVVFPGRGVVGVENNFLVGPECMERLNRFPDRPLVV
jgi:Xaa-Pro aminopeptidase